MNTKRIKPGPGQESVWDYPRPPKLETFSGHIRIQFNGEVILDTNEAYRVLETSHPPTYYIPIDHFQTGVLIPIQKSSFCEFKGMASYFDIQVGNKRARASAWGYLKARGNFAVISNHVSVYAHLMDACIVNDEVVQAQAGDFYGGWITSNIVGPFKGGAGTMGW